MMISTQLLQNAAQSRIFRSSATSMRQPRLAGLVVYSSKGFGKGTKPQKKSDDEDMAVPGQGQQTKRAGRNKGKQQMRVGQAAMQAAQQQRGPAMTVPAADVPPVESVTDQLEFEERLKALKAESERKKAEVSSQSTNILDREPSYDNPPPLTSTLFGSKDGNAASEREYTQGSFGPSQVGLAVASLALVGVFLVANGGSDLGYATRRPTPQVQTELAPEQKADLEKQLDEETKKLEANKDDLEALEAAAILHARLGQFDVAAEQLERLAAAKPSVDVWRVLAETRAAAGELSKSTEAYRKAWSASSETNLEVLTGLAGSLADEGKAQQAVDLIRSLSSSDKAKDLGEVELGLLLAKTYGQWRGHGTDALAQYDALSEAYPQDFRVPLGKALMLREQGREGDAQRYIIQAKYLAPPASRPVVDALTAKR